MDLSVESRPARGRKATLVAKAIEGPVQPSGQPIVRAEATDDGRLFLVEGQKAGFKVELNRWLIRISGS